MPVQRIELLGVPVDVCPRRDFEQALFALASRKGSSRICFITVWDLLRARGKSDFAQAVRSADLVFPVSKSIARGAAFLKKPVPVRYNPFDTLVRMLGALESRYRSLYILGGRREALADAEKNIRLTFPNLELVGYHAGYYARAEETLIIQTISRASPALTLVSEGVRERDAWHYLHRERFSSGMFVYFRDAVGIFGRRIKRPSAKAFERGGEIWGEIVQNPLKIFLVFPFLRYLALLVCERLFGPRVKG